MQLKGEVFDNQKGHLLKYNTLPTFFLPHESRRAQKPTAFLKIH